MWTAYLVSFFLQDLTELMTVSTPVPAATQHETVQGQVHKKTTEACHSHSFVIGHIPSEIVIEGECGPRQIDLTDKQIGETMCVALVRHSHTGSYLHSLEVLTVGDGTVFILRDESISHRWGEQSFRSTGTNVHIL